MLRTRLPVICAHGQLLAYENGEIDYFDRLPFGDLKRRGPQLAQDHDDPARRG